MARRLYDEYGNEFKARKRGGCFKWLGIGFILFLAIGVIGSMGQDDNTSSAPQSVSIAPTEQPAEQEVKQVEEETE